MEMNTFFQVASPTTLASLVVDTRESTVGGQDRLRLGAMAEMELEDNVGPQEAAELIAAAGRGGGAVELLAALRGMVDMFERHIEGRPGPDDAAQRWDAARAAIARATK